MRKHQRFDPRQTMHAPDFEIFHYCDAHPAPVAMHHHDFYEIYFFLGGSVEYRVEGSSYRMKPGDVLFISPMELHQPLVDSDGGDYERIVLWINRSFLDGLSSEDCRLTRCFSRAAPGERNLLRLPPSDREALGAKLMELLEESYSEAYGAKLAATGTFLQLMVALDRYAMGQDAAAHRSAPPPLVAQAIDFIAAHYQEKITLDSLASQFYVSKYHLSHAFQKSVGVSVYRYLILKRLVMAKQLLAQGVGAAAAGGACGFGDYTNFYRAFKAEYGISPSEYGEIAKKQGT